MSNLSPPFPIQNPSIEFGASVLYNLLGRLASPGVLGSGDFAVAQHAAGANFTVDVAPGAAMVTSTNGYGGQNSDLRFMQMAATSTNGSGNSDWASGTPAGASNVFAAADSTNPRIDQVVLVVDDSNLDSTGLYAAQLGIVGGTATAGATLANLNGAASLPTNCLLLAYVLIPASATTITTADISDQRSRSMIGGLPSSFGFGVALGSRLLSAATFPSSPIDGDLLDVQVASGANYATNWMLRYNDSAPGAYPWEFVGGAPMTAQTTGADTTSSTSYADLAGGANPSITVPRTGYYIVGYEVLGANGTGGDAVFVTPMSATLAAADVNGAKVFSPAGNNAFTLSGETIPVLLTKGETLKLQYKVNAGTGTFSNRTLSLTPVAVQ